MILIVPTDLPPTVGRGRYLYIGGIIAMGKLKSLFEEQKNDVKEIFIKYIATIAAVFLFCVVTIINIDVDRSTEIYEEIMAFFAIFAAGSFFIETVLKKNKLLMYAVDALVAFVLTLMGFNLDEWVSQDALETFEKFFALYIMLLIGTGLYVIIRNSGLSFQRYANTVILNFLRWGFIFIIFNIGMYLILAIFSALIFHIRIYEFFDKLELLLTGLLYFPYALICIVAKKEEKPKFFKVVIKYILMPMLLIAMGIIYIYILKMIFTLNVPNNEVFYICAGVFAFGFYISTMAYAYVDDVDEEIKPLGIYDKIIKYLKYGFIPMVLLEIYAIGVRIAEYGVTEDRYMAVVFIIAQIIYLAWEPIDKLISGFRRSDEKKVSGYYDENGNYVEIDVNSDDVAANADKKTGFGKNYEKLIFVGILMYTFVVIIPPVNMDYTCYASQKKRFEKAMSEGDYISAKSALNELEYSKYGKRYIDTNYTQEELQELNAKYYDSRQDGYNTVYGKLVSISYDKDNIDISGYSRMYPLSVYYGTKGDMHDLELDITPDNYHGNEAIVLRDVSVIVNDAITQYEDMRDRYDYNTEPAYEYICSGNVKLMLTHVSFDYFEDGKTIDGLSMTGYILVK